MLVLRFQLCSRIQRTIMCNMSIVYGRIRDSGVSYASRSLTKQIMQWSGVGWLIYFLFVVRDRFIWKLMIVIDHCSLVVVPWEWWKEKINDRLNDGDDDGVICHDMMCHDDDSQRVFALNNVIIIIIIIKRIVCMTVWRMYWYFFP